MKTVTISLCIILAALLFLQWRCSGKTEAALTAALVDSKVADSIAHVRENALIDSNMALMVDMGLKDIEANRTIDSLTTIINNSKQSLQSHDSRIANLIRTIREYATTTKDSTAGAQADTLQELYNGAKDNVIYLLGEYDKRDSVYMGQVQYKDSVIVAQQETIASLDRNFQQQAIIISNLQAALDSSIHTGNRKNILRTIERIGIALAGFFLGRASK